MVNLQSGVLHTCSRATLGCVDWEMGGGRGVDENGGSKRRKEGNNQITGQRQRVSLTYLEELTVPGTDGRDGDGGADGTACMLLYRARRPGTVGLSSTPAAGAAVSGGGGGG